MANSAIDSGVVELAERLGADRKVDRERMTAIETSVSELSNTVNTKESNLQKQIDTNKSAIIAGDSTTLESAKEYSDSQLSIHDASNESHSYIQGNVSGVDNRVGGIESLLNGVMYEDNIVEGTDYTKIVDIDNVAGSGTVKSYGGKTLVWNQLIRPNTNEYSKERDGITFTKSSSNQYGKVTGTATSGDVWFSYFASYTCTGVTAGHKYYVTYGSTKAELTYWGMNDYVKLSGSVRSAIYTPDVTTTYSYIQLRFKADVTYDFIINPLLFDLTLMFGAGNEPATVEEFEAMFPADYYEYNAGELLSAGVSEVQSVGRNLCRVNKKTITGTTSYASTIGSILGTCIDKNIDIVGIKHISISGYAEVAENLTIFLYNEKLSENLISHTGVYLNVVSNGKGVQIENHSNIDTQGYKYCAITTGNNAIIGTPANTKITFTVKDIQIEIGDTATDYAPYREPVSLPIPAEVQLLEGYGWSAGSAKNWIDWENRVYHREVGVYHFTGNENIVLINTSDIHIEYRVATSIKDRLGIWECPIKSNKFIKISGYFTAPYQCGWTDENSNLVTLSFSTSYNTEDLVKEWLKTNQVTMYYELAEPELIDISNILPSNNTLPIETGGTITFKNSHGNDYRIPVPNTLNLPTKIDQFGNTLNSAKDYSDTLLIESKSFTTKTSLERAIEAHYALQRTGKLYQVKIPLYDINPTIECIKTLDNEGLVCEPSTDSVEGRDDYADIPLFQWVYCNYIRDDDGTPRPISIEGMDDFKLTGSVDVGVMQMSFYGKMEQDDEYQILTISDMPHPELGLIPWKNCIDSTGKVLPWNIYSAFQVVTADDGLYRSQPNKAPGYKFSHNNMITYFQKKGKGYWGGTADRNAFQRIFTLIKYAKKSSQAVFAGCTGYSFQHTVSVAESDVKRVIVTTSQGNSYVVGQCVSVGESYNGTSNNRNYDILHSIADRVLVTAKENVTIDDTEYTAIYLDVPENFTTTSTSVVSSMPCYTGQTMKVKGHHDGSITSNTNSYYGYRVQGVEYAIGQWIVASDTVGYLNDALTKPSLVYVAPRGLAHSSTESVIKSTYTVAGEMTINLNADSTNRVDAPIGDVGLIDFANGVIYPTVKGTSTANGVGDYFYQGGASLNTCREWLMAGILGNGSDAGSAFLRLWGGLGGADWHYGAAD